MLRCYWIDFSITNKMQTSNTISLQKSNSVSSFLIYMIYFIELHYHWNQISQWSLIWCSIVPVCIVIIIQTFKFPLAVNQMYMYLHLTEPSLIFVYIIVLYLVIIKCFYALQTKLKCLVFCDILNIVVKTCYYMLKLSVWLTQMRLCQNCKRFVIDSEWNSWNL